MTDHGWAKHGADGLRGNGIRLFATVPDYIVSHVLDELWGDPECRVVTTPREEEAVGLLSGAWLAGHRGALLMQNSGLGNCTNALAAPSSWWTRPARSPRASSPRPRPARPK
jgi:sulfopyruvate decarboxylase TPP-binding subunit